MAAGELGAYSTSGLLELLEAVRKALEIEDGLPEGADRLFGVRTFPDWRRWSTAIEAELHHREISFPPIQW